MTEREEKIVGKLMSTDRKTWDRIGTGGPYHSQCFNLKYGGYDLLVSYKTPIILKTPRNVIVPIWDGYTKTTMGHIGTFCRNHRVPIITGAMWMKMRLDRRYSYKDIEELRKSK